MTLAFYAESWLRDKRGTVRDSTLDFYRANILHLDGLGGLPLNRITPQHVRDLIAARTAEQYASRTIRGVVQTLALILKRAQEDELVTRNVAAIVAKPPLEQAEPEHFTVEQVRQFLEVAQGEALWSLFAVAFGTGLRRGEALALTWRDVDADASLHQVQHGHRVARRRPRPLRGCCRVSAPLRPLRRCPATLGGRRPGRADWWDVAG